MKLIIFFFLFFLAFPGNKLYPENPPTVKELLSRISAIENELKSPVTLSGINDLLKEVSQIREFSNTCLQNKQNELDETNSALESIGEFVEGESPEITKKRKKLLDTRLNLEKELSACKFVFNSSQNLQAKLEELRKSLVKKQLLFKDYHFIQESSTFIKNLSNFASDLKSTLNNLNINITKIHIYFFLLAICISLIIVFLSYKLFQKLVTNKEHQKFLRENLHFVFTALTLLLSLIFLVLHKQVNILDDFVLSFIFISLYTLLLYIFLKIYLKIRLIKVNLPKNFFKQTIFVSSILLINNFFCLLLILNSFSLVFPEYILNFFRSLFFIVSLFLFFFFINKYLSKYLTSFTCFLIKLFLYPFILVILWLKLFGYNNLSVFLYILLNKFVILLLILYVTNLLISLFFQRISFSDGKFETKIRNILSINKGEYFSYLLWIELLIKLVISISIISFFIYLLNLSHEIDIKVKEFLVDGFKIYNINLSPLKLIFALFLLLLLIGIIRWVKRYLEINLSKFSDIEKSEIDSIVTIFSYISYVVVIFIFLASAGFNISNLALIGGALSVGIGFGLQNIVNNFVSGLILLFERPIKKGDWIVVKNTEGYVKRISIRSTVIQTFDRCDVIVPNSELISNQVQNWMFDDRIGRVRVNVGVAYDSDVELVRETLLDIARNHPLTVLDGTVPGPIVWFTDFGESSLNFQLLFYIKDIDRRLATASEVRFAIFKAFKEKNIKIPFPQRDIHIYHETIKLNKDSDNEE